MNNSASSFDGLFFAAAVRGYVEENPRFLRRDWLAAQLDEKLREPGKRFVLLTAEPGAGKSVFMAQLAYDHPDWLRHFIRRDQRSVLSDVSDKSLLLRIGYQLAALRPELFSQEQLRVSVSQRFGQVAEQGEAIGAEVKRLTASPFYQKVLQIEQHVQANAGKVIGLRVEELVLETRLLSVEDLLHLALIDPARALQRIDPKEQIVLLVDALDEIRYHTTAENILAWLTNCPALPDNIRFVLTSRPPDEMLNLFRTKQADSLAELAIAEEDAHVKQDIERFVTKLVNEPQVAAQVVQAAEGGGGAFAKKATDKAHGNLGYLDALARGIDQAVRSDDQAGLQALLSLKELPGDLGELCAFFLHQIKQGVGEQQIVGKDSSGKTYSTDAWPAVYEPVLGVLAVAAEPLEMELISKLGDIAVDSKWVRPALNRLTQFLDIINGRYRFYHTTVAEFLTADSTQSDPNSSDLYVDPINAHRQIARVLGQDPDNLWVDTGEDVAEQARRLYARRYYVDHLYLGRAWNQLFAVIDTGKYGQGKLRFDPSTYLYVRDLDLARDASMRSEAAQAELMALLPRLWRYSLLRCSLTSNAGVLPPDAFYVLASLGKGDQATGLAQLIAEPERQAEAFHRISEILVQMPGSQDRAARLLREAYSVAGRVLDPRRRADLLAKLADMTQFMFNNARFFDQQAVDEATQQVLQIPGVVDRAAALRALARYLYQTGKRPAADQLVLKMEETLIGAGEYSESDRVRSDLAGAYAELEEWERSRRAAGGLENLIARADALAYLATRQYQVGAAEAAKETVRQALALAGDIGLDPITQGRILFAVSPVPAACDPEKRLGQLLYAARDRLQGQDPCTIDPRFWTDMSAALMRQGEPDSAIELLGQAKACMIQQLRAQEPTSGPAMRFDVSIVEAASGIARLGQWQMALEVAPFLPPSDRLNVLVAIVEGLVGAGNWDKALELADEIGRVNASTSVRISFTSSSSASADPTSWAFYLIVEGLADQRNWVRALEVAEHIDQLYTRCQALSRIALMQLVAADNKLAAETLAKQDRTVRLWHTRGDKDEILSVSVNMLVRTGAWSDARAVAEQIGTVEIRSAARHAIAEALIRVDDRATLNGVVAEMEDPAGRAHARTALALKLKEAADDQAASAALAEARGQALQIEDGATRSAALRKIALTLAAWGDAPAKQVLTQAVEALNTAKRFGVVPTPWSDLCVDAARVDMWDQALRIAHGLVDHDAFDGATALRNLAVYCHRIGRDDQATGLLADAGQAALKIRFPPQRADMQTRLAAAYAETGLGDGTSSAEMLPEPLRPDGFVRVAEVLAKAGKPTEAMFELGKLRNATGRIFLAYVDQTQRAIIDAWLAAGDTKQALTVAEAIPDERQQVEGLTEIGGRLLDLGQHDDALRILGQAGDLARERNAVWTGTALASIAEQLAKVKEYRMALILVQGEWRRSASRRQLVERLPMVVPLVSCFADLGKDVSTSAAWIESFLAGV